MMGVNSNKVTEEKNTKSKKMPMLIISTNIETGSTDSLSVNVTM